MKTCICTVIKDEQEYLDEWIKYHLNLGIDRIFIFEDVDSTSHKTITNKYKEVTLFSINKVLNNDEQKRVRNAKILRSFNPQHIYFKNILHFIKTYYISYQWCFVIDADEFITMQNPNDSLALIESFRDFDAVILSWKCYGANGYVEKPDYKNGGLVDTYTKEVEGYIRDNFDSLVKTCWNMRRYKEAFFYNQHHPSDEANWTNTEFCAKDMRVCYSNIYIRHYITKSWQEYAWKMNTRGFCWGGNRSYDFFFAANPDLKPRREELINMVEKEVLVVLPYEPGEVQGDEIVLALSAWRKFCQFRYKFVVIGTFSQQLQDKFPWVEFVSCPKIQPVTGQYVPHLDIQHKMEVAMQMYGNKYPGFIWMVDDNYAIKPFNANDILTVHYLQSSFVGRKDLAPYYWQHDLYKTRQLLDRYKFNHINFTTHYPCYFEFEKLKKIWDTFNMRNESYIIENLYFNIFPPKNTVLADYVRLGVWSKEIFDEKFEAVQTIPNIKFVCNSVEGWSKELGEGLSKIIFDNNG